MTYLEMATGAALLGSVLAIAVPAFNQEIHASRFVEATDGLARIGANAVAYAAVHHRFPESTQLTPTVPPRGAPQPDAPGLWEGAVWKALTFHPVPDGVPHSYSFSFENTGGSVGSSFVAQARGDLDGDGVLSTFEIRGELRGTEFTLVPGMYVEAELE
jgi:hypothetical protein